MKYHEIPTNRSKYAFSDKPRPSGTQLGDEESSFWEVRFVDLLLVVAVCALLGMVTGALSALAKYHVL